MCPRIFVGDSLIRNVLRQSASRVILLFATKTMTGIVKLVSVVVNWIMMTNRVMMTTNRVIKTTDVDAMMTTVK